MTGIRIIIVFLALPFYLFAQETDSIQKPIVPVDEITELITYRDVVETEGDSKELFKRAINWISDYYKNAASVTTRRDYESGVIEGNHRFKIYNQTEDGVNSEGGTILYSFSLEFKDGRFRYTYNDLALKGASRFPLERWLDKNDPQFSEYNLNQLRKVDEFIQGLIKDLTEGMQPPKAVEEEEW